MLSSKVDFFNSLSCLVGNSLALQYCWLLEAQLLVHRVLQSIRHAHGWAQGLGHQAWEVCTCPSKAVFDEPEQIDGWGCFADGRASSRLDIEPGAAATLDA